jgi:hypothetical protein
MEFHVSIDFNDDLWLAKQRWDEEKLRALIRTYAERGIRGIHWQDQGTIHDGVYDKGGYIDRLGTAWDFIQRVPDPLNVVADEAHKHNLQVFSYIKVFDLSASMPWNALPAGEPHHPPTGVPYIGGEGPLAHRWIRENPDLRAELHPALQETQPRHPIRSIRLWHDAANLPKGDFQIFTSHNNRNYSLYAGPQTISMTDRRRRTPIFVPAPNLEYGPEALVTCVEFSDLCIEAAFIAIVPVQPTQLGNTLAALVEMEDSQGQNAVFTYGLGPIMTPEIRLPDWRTAGIAFDGAYNTPVPGRGWTMTQSGGRFRVEVSGRGFVGLARGRNQFLGGVVELAYPQVRDWIKNIAMQAVEAGCDGVDIRTSTHTESLDWENYGFGRPVIDEFKRRHGVDITKQSFDRALWRKLRGDYFDLMLQEVGDATRARGKLFSVQLYDYYDKTADEFCYHEIYFDWRKWCRERRMDIVNLKSFKFRNSFYPEVVKLCHDTGIPLMMTPSMHSATDEVWASEGRELFEHCVNDGIGVYNIYESAAVMRLGEQGFEPRCPTMWKLLDEFR